MIENVLSKVAKNPDNYSAKIDRDSVTFYEKSTGESEEINEPHELILSQVLNELGIEAEQV